MTTKLHVVHMTYSTPAWGWWCTPMLYRGTDGYLLSTCACGAQLYFENGDPVGGVNSTASSREMGERELQAMGKLVGAMKAAGVTSWSFTIGDDDA